MDRLVELLDSACSANGLAYTRGNINFLCLGSVMVRVAMTHKGTRRDPEIARPP